MIKARVQGLEYSLIIRRITQGDGYIAQPAFIADATDGRACGALQKFLLAPGKYLDEQGRIQAVAR